MKQKIDLMQAIRCEKIIWGTFLLISMPALAQFEESFDDLEASSHQYEDGSFTGENARIWDYRGVRLVNDEQRIEGNSLGFGPDSQESRILTTRIDSEGIDSLDFKWKSYFSSGTASDRGLRVTIDDRVIYEETLETMDETVDVSITDIDAEAPLELTFKSIGSRQIMLDSIHWAPLGESRPEPEENVLNPEVKDISAESAMLSWEYPEISQPDGFLIRGWEEGGKIPEIIDGERPEPVIEFEAGRIIMLVSGGERTLLLTGFRPYIPYNVEVIPYNNHYDRIDFKEPSEPSAVSFSYEPPVIYEPFNNDSSWRTYPEKSEEAWKIEDGKLSLVSPWKAEKSIVYDTGIEEAVRFEFNLRYLGFAKSPKPPGFVLFSNTQNDEARLFEVILPYGYSPFVDRQWQRISVDLQPEELGEVVSFGFRSPSSGMESAWEIDELTVRLLNETIPSLLWNESEGIIREGKSLELMLENPIDRNLPFAFSWNHAEESRISIQAIPTAEDEISGFELTYKSSPGWEPEVRGELFMATAGHTLSSFTITTESRDAPPSLSLDPNIEEFVEYTEADTQGFWLTLDSGEAPPIPVDIRLSVSHPDRASISSMVTLSEERMFIPVEISFNPEKEKPWTLVVSAKATPFGEDQATVQVRDVLEETTPSITFLPADLHLLEGETSEVEIIRSGLRDDPLDVRLYSSDNAIIDYPDSVTFSRGETRKTIVVEVYDDEVAGNTRVVNLVAVAGGYANGKLNLSITDNDEVREMKVEIGDSTILEGGKLAFRIDLDPALEESHKFTIFDEFGKLRHESWIGPGTFEFEDMLKIAKEPGYQGNRNLTLTFDLAGYPRQTEELMILEQDRILDLNLFEDYIPLLIEGWNRLPIASRPSDENIPEWELFNESNDKIAKQSQGSVGFVKPLKSGMHKWHLEAQDKASLKTEVYELPVRVKSHPIYGENPMVQPIAEMFSFDSEAWKQWIASLYASSPRRILREIQNYPSWRNRLMAAFGHYLLKGWIPEPEFLYMGENSLVAILEQSPVSHFSGEMLDGGAQLWETLTQLESPGESTAFLKEKPLDVIKILFKRLTGNSPTSHQLVQSYSTFNDYEMRYADDTQSAWAAFMSDWLQRVVNGRPIPVHESEIAPELEYVEQHLFNYVFADKEGPVLKLNERLPDKMDLALPRKLWTSILEISGVDCTGAWKTSFPHWNWHPLWGWTWEGSGDGWYWTLDWGWTFCPGSWSFRHWIWSPDFGWVHVDPQQFPMIYTREWGWGYAFCEYGNRLWIYRYRDGIWIHPQ